MLRETAKYHLAHAGPGIGADDQGVRLEAADFLVKDVLRLAGEGIASERLRGYAMPRQPPRNVRGRYALSFRLVAFLDFQYENPVRCAK